MQTALEIVEGPGPPPPYEVRACRNPTRTVFVRLGMFGQFQVVLCETPRPGGIDWHGHGEILRQACTYNGVRALELTLTLAASVDPDGYLESLARPWNCEHPGGRIRLDTTPDERPELCRAAGARR